MITRPALALWLDVTRHYVSAAALDLSSRQQAILLTVALGGPNGVRDLARHLSISKPAVSRAMDTLGILGLAERQRDENDTRNVRLRLTLEGKKYLSNLEKLIEGKVILSAAERS